MFLTLSHKTAADSLFCLDFVKRKFDTLHIQLAFNQMCFHLSFFLWKPRKPTCACMVPHQVDTLFHCQKEASVSVWKCKKNKIEHVFLRCLNAKCKLLISWWFFVKMTKTKFFCRFLSLEMNAHAQFLIQFGTGETSNAELFLLKCECGVRGEIGIRS